MCQFLSAIVLRNGDVLYNPATDSHEDLVALHNLRDNRDGNFARVEFKPDKPEDLDKPEKYKLCIDETITPEWFGAQMKDKTAEHLRSIVKMMVVNDKRNCLVGGTAILGGCANVGYLRDVRIISMLGTSKVGAMWGTSKVGAMLDTSQVGAMRGTSQVGAMWGTSKVGAMWDTAKVGAMWDTAKVVNDNRVKG